MTTEIARFQNLKNRLTVAAGVVLFLLGVWHFGFPPYTIKDTQQAAAAKTAAPDAGEAAGGRMIITHNNGAPEDDKKRQTEQDLMRSLFEKACPDATLKYSTWQFSPDTFFAKYIAGTLPDVIGVFATEAAIVIDRGMAADITAEMKLWKLYPHLIPRMIDLITRGGRIFGMPAGGDSGFYVMTLFYNKDILSAAGLTGADGNVIPPNTWDDFTTYALKLTDRRVGRAGFGILGETAGSGWHFLNWVWQAGGEIMRRRPDGSWESCFHEPGAVRALQFIKDLRWKHDVLQRNVISNNDDLYELFSSGRIAMSMHAPDNLNYITYKFNMPAERIGICLLPAGPAGRANQIGGAFILLNPQIKGARRQRAFDSLTFGLDPAVIDQKLQLLRQQGRPVGIPVIPIFKPEYQDKINAIVNKHRNMPDYTALMREAAEVAHAEPPCRCQALYSQYLGPCVQEVLVNRNADPAALLGEASARFQERELDPINRELKEAVRQRGTR
ncbi:MAG: extracellular solute-binding protein [bacterium]|nr:extracellular solute-binding protein [Candidatus Sumerlaeota bacterium]